MKRSELLRDVGWRRVVFRRAMTRAGAALILCALARGLLGQRFRLMFGACAACFLLVAAAWREYCAFRDGRTARRGHARTPDLLRGAKPARGHRPAFRMDSSDFDDDLTPATAVDEERLSPGQRAAAHIAADLAAAVLMLAFSFLPV